MTSSSSPSSNNINQSNDRSHERTWSSDRWAIGNLPSSPHIWVVIHLCVACLGPDDLSETISLLVKPLLIPSNLNVRLGHGYVAVVSIEGIFHPSCWSVLEVLHPAMPCHHRKCCRPYCVCSPLTLQKVVFNPAAFPVPHFTRNLGGVTIY